MSQPWFPFYVGDYVRDTARLTTEGHGAYLLLMLDYWANGAPPDDDETLSSIARLSLDVWHKLRPKLAPFFNIEGGRWLHGRIEKELAIANEKHAKRVAAGKAGGEAKAKRQHSSSIATGNADELLYQSQPQPQSLKKDISRPKAAEHVSRFDEFWKAYPKRKGDNPRKPAEAKFNALVKSGVDPQMLIDAVRKYASEKADKIGTEFIPMAQTWLGQQRWADHAAVAAVAPFEGGPAMTVEQAVAQYAKLGRWSRHAPCPEPGSLGFAGSNELLAKYGLDAIGRKMPPKAA